MVTKEEEIKYALRFLVPFQWDGNYWYHSSREIINVISTTSEALDTSYFVAKNHSMMHNVDKVLLN